VRRPTLELIKGKVAGMAAERSPSPIITHFVEAIKPILPDSDQQKLETYSDAISRTDHKGDFRRAWHCGDWAIRLAVNSSKPSQRLVKGLREKLSLWKDTVAGDKVDEDAGPGLNIQLRWVEEAVAIAGDRAANSGWDSVDWENHLNWMLDVGSTRGDPRWPFTRVGDPNSHRDDELG
jgi:hypothetical protein